MVSPETEITPLIFASKQNILNICTPFVKFIKYGPVIPLPHDVINVTKRFHSGFYKKCKDFMMQCIGVAELVSMKRPFYISFWKPRSKKTFS